MFAWASWVASELENNLGKSIKKNKLKGSGDKTFSDFDNEEKEEVDSKELLEIDIEPLPFKFVPDTVQLSQDTTLNMADNNAKKAILPIPMPIKPLGFYALAETGLSVTSFRFDGGLYSQDRMLNFDLGLSLGFEFKNGIHAGVGLKSMTSVLDSYDELEFTFGETADFEWYVFDSYIKNGLKETEVGSGWIYNNLDQ